MPERYCYQKIYVLPSRAFLTGEVEVDEAYLGGVKNKELIGIAVEKRGITIGRIRLKLLKDAIIKKYMVL